MLGPHRIHRISVEEWIAKESWVVSIGALGHYRTSYIGPTFEDRNKAVRVACAVSRSFRETEVPQASAVVVSDAKVLYALIEEEIDSTWSMINDSKRNELSAGKFEYVDTLQSIELDQDNYIHLDFDQTVAVWDVLETALETAEDLEEGEPTPKEIRRLVRLWEAAAGFPFEWSTYHEDYVIKLGSENPSMKPYEVYCKEEIIGATTTIIEGRQLIKVHKEAVIAATGE